ncbi:MAG: hypothetical protein AA908_11075 [Chlorobi bacterium NICIL-2]|nr:MAG: hypothetical protein AA908_11075 [Chlorobi bacterium NICIL-2]
MRTSIQLEACVNSFQSALLAAEAGADRIELCDNLHAGGTTPSAGTIQQVKARLQIPVFVMIRPRGGNFSYSEAELEIMKTDIRLCKNLGCDGVVLGVLLPDRQVDVAVCRQLVELAWPMETTFHRAFDLTPDPEKALSDILSCGFQYVLSSGQQRTAVEGMALLQHLQDVAGETLDVIAAGGIRSSHLPTLMKDTAIRWFHSGASIPLPFENPENAPFSLSDTQIDPAEIKKMKQILKEGGNADRAKSS